MLMLMLMLKYKLKNKKSLRYSQQLFTCFFFLSTLMTSLSSTLKDEVQALMKNMTEQQSLLQSAKQTIGSQREHVLAKHNELRGVISALIARVREASKDKSSCNARYEELESQLEGLRKELGDANAAKAKLQSELVNCRENIKRLEQTAEEAKMIERDLRDKIEELSSQIERLNQSLRDQHVTDEELSQSNTDLNSRIEKLMIDVEALRSERDKLESDLEEERNAHNLIKEALAEARAEINGLKGEIEGLKKELADTRKKLSEVNQREDVAKEALAKCNSDLDAALEKITELERTIEDLQNQQSGLQHDKTELENDFLAILKEIHQTKRNTIDSSVAELKRETELLSQLVTSADEVLQLVQSETGGTSPTVSSLSPAPGMSLLHNIQSPSGPKIRPGRKRLITPNRGASNKMKKVYTFITKNVGTDMNRALSVNQLAHKLKISVEDVQKIVSDLEGDEKINSTAADTANYGVTGWNDGLTSGEKVFYKKVIAGGGGLPPNFFGNLKLPRIFI